MTDGEYFTRTLEVSIHSNKKIDVVYTNDSAEVEKVLQRYEGSWIWGYELFVGLDFEYTKERNTAGSLYEEVLVFH